MNAVPFACPDRKACYEAVSRLATGGMALQKTKQCPANSREEGAQARTSLNESGRFHGSVSNLGREPFRCTSPDAAEGYRFSRAMKNPAFISCEDIRNIYLPMGFSQFKIEGPQSGQRPAS